MVALGEIYSKLPDYVQGLAIAYELSDRFLAEGLADLNDRFHQVPVDRIVSKIADERTVDLEVVDIQVLELV